VKWALTIIAVLVFGALIWSITRMIKQSVDAQREDDRWEDDP
jgi:hypothetical protein